MYALLDRADEGHDRARDAFAELLEGSERLVSHNYVLVEATALLQRRLGMAAARDLRDAIVPVLTVVWVDEALHDRAAAAHVAAGHRKLSLVDHVSFEVMRSAAIRRALAFDEGFARAGFELIPAEAP